MKRSYSTMTTPSNTQELHSFVPSTMVVRKRRKLRRRGVEVPRFKMAVGNGSAFPPKKRATLRYVQTITLDPGAGGTAQNLFRTIGLYDPDASLGGHQPYGYDQWMAIYARYHVISSKISIQACSAAQQTTTNCWRVGISPIDRSSSLPTAAEDLMEISGAVYGVHEYKAAGPIRLSVKHDTKKVYGVKDVLDNEHLSGTINALPQDNTYWIVWAANGGAGVEDAAPVTVNVTIDYDVWFTDVNDVTHS